MIDFQAYSEATKDENMSNEDIVKAYKRDCVEVGVVSVLSEIRSALSLFGYDLDKHSFHIVIRPDRTVWQYEVQLDNEYFGVWDTNRKTFVD